MAWTGVFFVFLLAGSSWVVISEDTSSAASGDYEHHKCSFSCLIKRSFLLAVFVLLLFLLLFVIQV